MGVNTYRMLNNLGQCLFMIGFFCLVPAGLIGLDQHADYAVMLFIGTIFVVMGFYLSYFFSNQLRR